MSDIPSDAELEHLEFEAMELHPAAEFWADCVALREEARAAIEVAGKTKAELVADVAERYEELGPQLMRFSKAAELARSLAELLEAAERRMAVALAVVEGDDDCEGEWLQ